MNTLSKPCPLTICENFTRQELQSNKKSKIWMSCYPTMERLLDRSIEMKPVYKEICEQFGYRAECQNVPLWLTFEIIWSSGKESFKHKRIVKKELANLHESISMLAKELSDALYQQHELMETEGFSPDEYLDLVGTISLAGQNNGRYTGFIQEKLNQLNWEFDGKYWPKLWEIVSAIRSFQLSQSAPVQEYIPDEVMSGRESIIKDFVLTFDSRLRNCHQISNSFVFSNESLATIVNVVLDLTDSIATSEAVRVIRNRKKQGQYKKNK